MKNDTIHLTEQIHKLVRNQLSWEETIDLLHKISTSQQWMEHLEMDLAIYQTASKNQSCESVGQYLN
jgi:hypothetical protein